MSSSLETAAARVYKLLASTLPLWPATSQRLSPPALTPLFMLLLLLFPRRPAVTAEQVLSFTPFPKPVALQVGELTALLK